MPTIDEKLITFDKVIVEDALRARDLIRNQLHQESEQRITGIKSEIRSAAEQEYRREAHNAEIVKDSRISKASVDSRKMLINARNEILASVLAALEAKLSDFAQTDDYDSFMVNNIQEALTYAGAYSRDAGGDGDGSKGGDDAIGSGYSLYMTARDSEKYAKDAQRLAPGIITQSGGDDMIGGVRVANAGVGIFVDNTLKKKVELCADELFLMSGLTIDK